MKTYTFKVILSSGEEKQISNQNKNQTQAMMQVIDSEWTIEGSIVVQVQSIELIETA